MKTIRPVAYSYERCSSTKQIEGDTERRQWDENKACGEQFGFELSDERFFDAGVSAYRGLNFEANLGRILERIQPGEGLIFNDMDRFSRQNWKTAVDFLEKFLVKGVVVMTSRNRQQITLESFRKDPGSFLPVIMASHLGHAEDAKKAYYIRKAWETKRAEIRAGTAIRQKLPGWLEHEKQVVGGKIVLGKIVVNDAKAKIVREIFRLTLKGWSRRRIAKDFNARAVPSVSGQVKHWNSQSILACIVRNPAVIGDYRMPDTGEVIKGIFPRIVGDEVFYRANASATGRKKQTTAQVANNLVTGLIRCPGCGGNMRLNRKHKSKGKVHSYLVCSGQLIGKTDCSCRPKYDAFEASLLALMRESALIRKAMGQQLDEQPDELTALRGKLQTADAKLNELMGHLEATPSKILARRVQVLEAEAEQMRGELQRKEAEQKATVRPDAAYETFARELSAHAQEGEYRERVKVCLRQMIDKIQFVEKTHYTVQFRGGAMVDVILGPSGWLFSPTPDWATGSRVND